ncbi:MAG: ATP-binding protein [Thermoanaerobaculales bacterium]
MARIFDRFFRVEPSRSRAHGGLGLGLAVARWAVEANGGRIEVRSEVGRGSTFTIALPWEGNVSQGEDPGKGGSR